MSRGVECANIPRLSTDTNQMRQREAGPSTLLTELPKMVYNAIIPKERLASIKQKPHIGIVEFAVLSNRVDG